MALDILRIEEGLAQGIVKLISVPAYCMLPNGYSGVIGCDRHVFDSLIKQIIE